MIYDPRLLIALLNNPQKRCNVRPTHSFTEPGRSSTDQHLINLHFHENIRTGNFLWTQHFDRRCVVTEMSRASGISVWRNVWATTNCCLMGYIYMYIYIYIYIYIYTHTLSMDAGRRRPKREANIKINFTMAISPLSTSSPLLILYTAKGNRWYA